MVPGRNSAGVWGADCGASGATEATAEHILGEAGPWGAAVAVLRAEAVSVARQSPLAVGRTMGISTRLAAEGGCGGAAQEAPNAMLVITAKTAVNQAARTQLGQPLLSVETTTRP